LESWILSLGDSLELAPLESTFRRAQGWIISLGGSLEWVLGDSLELAPLESWILSLGDSLELAPLESTFRRAQGNGEMTTRARGVAVIESSKAATKL
jgi:hypothetical protein